MTGFKHFMLRQRNSPMQAYRVVSRIDVTPRGEIVLPVEAEDFSTEIKNAVNYLMTNDFAYSVEIKNGYLVSNCAE